MNFLMDFFMKLHTAIYPHTLQEDYLTVLPDLDLLHQDNREELRKKFEDNIKPLITIALNRPWDNLSLPSNTF